MATNLSNWREPDHVNWAFSHIDRILNTQPIHRGNGKTWTLKFSPRDFHEFIVTSRDGRILDLPTFVKDTQTDGVIVIKNGEIAFEQYDRSNTRETKHLIMSMTKSVTGLLAGILVEQGKLNVDATIADYLPEMKGTSYEHITIRQCLDMRTGLEYDDASPDYRKAGGWSEYAAGEKQRDLHDFLSNFQAPASALTDGLEGGKFEYVSVNTDLLGWVLESVGGKTFAELASELIWQPMGAESDAYVATDRSGNARCAGGMCATVRDVARLCQLVLEDGKDIVPSSWIHDIVHNGSREAFAAGSWKRGYEKIFDSIAYRSYWLGDSNSETLMGIGVHGQMMFVDRLNKIVFVKTSSQPERIDVKKTGLTIAAFKEFQRILSSNEATVNGVS